MATNNAFWNQLLMRSDSIADIDPNTADAAAQVLAQLATVAEQFDRAFDPADQFEEYVAVNFCQALQRALTPKRTAPVCKVSVQNKILSASGNVASPPRPQPSTQELPTHAQEQPIKAQELLTTAQELPTKAVPPMGPRNATKPGKKPAGRKGRRGKPGKKP